ncbi:PDZ domain-containing protein, partial [uncultured Marinobacter sp.]
MEVMREGRQITLEVEIGKLPEEGAEQASAPASGNSGPSSAPLGMAVEPLPAELQESLGVSGGVLVTDVARGPALDAGIRPRDVITELNRRKITSVEDFREAVSSLPDDSAVSVRVVRQGRATYLVMKP